MRAIARIYMMAVRYYPKVLLLGYVTVLLSGLSALAIPRVLSASIDRALDSSNTDRGVDALISLGILLALLGIARGLFQGGQMFLGESLAQRIAYHIRDNYFRKLMHLSFAFHDKQATGSLMSLATADVEGVRMFINMGVIRSVFIAVMLFGSATAMLIVDVPLALMTMAFVPFLAFRGIYTSRQLRRMWTGVQELTADMVSVLQENLTGVRVVKAFAAEEHERRKFRERSFAVSEQTYLAERTWARNFAIMDFGFMLAIAVILWFGGNRVIDGRTVVDGQVVYTALTPGQLASFFVYLNMMVMPVRMLGRIVNIYSRAAASGERLFEILDAESPVSEAPGAKRLERVKGDVEFRNISFSYNGYEPALCNVSVTVPAGTRVALVGRPGSGKTTFAHLLPRFYDPTEGQILIDGEDARQFTLASLRENIGVVQQDVFIHTASIRDNVAYGDIDAEEERIYEMMRIAQLHDFIEELPQGYDTVVGERGVGLSGGQKQRLSIARTILLDPPILILDDSTSSVDVHTESLIQQMLEGVVSNRTTFLISNRFHAIARADKILVFKDGEIVQSGKHEELVSVEGEYQELYESQMRPLEEARRNAERLMDENGGSGNGTHSQSRQQHGDRA
jgi:ATP-binding cassette, subfamily B, multidrug efflux pump